jgi:hypothetical protein
VIFNNTGAVRLRYSVRVTDTPDGNNGWKEGVDAQILKDFSIPDEWA